jgi:hypothetical protein
MYITSGVGFGVGAAVTLDHFAREGASDDAMGISLLRWPVRTALSHVRRPHARSKDAAETGTVGTELRVPRHSE